MKSRTASIQSSPGFFCMQARSNFAGKFGCTSTKREIIIKPEFIIIRRGISVYTKKKKIVITEKGKKFKKNLLKKVQEFEKRLSDSLTPIFVTLELQKLLWLWITER